MFCRAFFPRLAAKCATVPRCLTSHIHQWATVSCVGCVVRTRQLHNTGALLPATSDFTSRSFRILSGTRGQPGRQNVFSGNASKPWQLLGEKSKPQGNKMGSSSHGKTRPRYRFQRPQISAAGDQGHHDVPHAAAVTLELLRSAATTTKEQQGVFGGTLPPWQRVGWRIKYRTM